MDQSELQEGQTSASDQEPQDAEFAAGGGQDVNAEKTLEIPESPGGKARTAAWRLSLSEWRARFKQSLSRLGHPAAEQDIDSRRSKDQSVENEVGNGSEAEIQQAVRESNVPEFNPLVVSADTARSSDEIFSDLGRQLKQRREMLSLTVEEVERHIHVRAAFLNALERGALEELPSPVQTRGMFVNYVSFLDLDVDSFLLRFADGLQARHQERHPQKPARGRPIKVNEKVPPLSTFIAGDLLIGGGMIILLILFTIWGVSRVVVMHAQYYPQVTAPAIRNLLAQTSEPTSAQSQLVTLIPAQDTPSTATPLATVVTATLPASITVELNLVAVERTYMRVSVDGKVQFDGEAVPGTAYPYEAKSQVEVLVGSASGLSVTYNGNNLGLMGTFGQVVDNIYTAQGVATPTATPLPSATATPRISPTPTSTPSLVPTPTSGE